MKVIATQRGFYQQLIEPGQLFTLNNPEKDFSDRWMKKFTSGDKAQPAPARRPKRESIVLGDIETLKELGEETSNPEDEGWK